METKRAAASSRVLRMRSGNTETRGGSSETCWIGAVHRRLWSWEWRPKTFLYVVCIVVPVPQPPTSDALKRHRTRIESPTPPSASFFVSLSRDDARNNHASRTKTGPVRPGAPPRTACATTGTWATPPSATHLSGRRERRERRGRQACRCGGIRELARSWFARCLSIRILAASVPSSGCATSRNHGCWRACLAVMRWAGSYTKIFFKRSRNCLENAVLLGIMSWALLAGSRGRGVSRAPYGKPLHCLDTSLGTPRGLEGRVI